jgi:Zn-dependent protease
MMETLFSLELTSFLIAVVIAITIHEFSHAFVANYLGDPTAKYEGRLSLNPTSHFDLYGSVIFVISLIASVYARFPFIFGWGKPVPVNPYNLKHRHGELLVSLSGPISNFLLAILVIIIVALLPANNGLGINLIGIANSLSGITGYGGLIILAGTIISVNVALGIFNLLPVPPLDGSRILSLLFPPGQSDIGNFMQKYGLLIIILIFFFGLNILGLLVHFVVNSLLALGILLNHLIY